MTSTSPLMTSIHKDVVRHGSSSQRKFSLRLINAQLCSRAFMKITQNLYVDFLVFSKIGVFSIPKYLGMHRNFRLQKIIGQKWHLRFLVEREKWLKI